MVWWLFKKRSDNTIDPEAIKNSFGNIKHDMNHISNWIGHFKTKHEEHNNNHEELIRRIEILEKRLATVDVIEEQEESEKEFSSPLDEIEEERQDNEKPLFPSSQWDELTDTQKQVCWFLAKLKKEAPKGWVSLKSLASEMYPEKEYHKIRSAVSQFVSVLEEQGFVKRKRVGKQAYILLGNTFKNQKKEKIHNKKENKKAKKAKTRKDS